MSSNLPIGTYTTTLNNLSPPNTILTQRRAIGVIGHSTAAPATIIKYDDDTPGEVYTCNSLGEALELLGGKVRTVANLNWTDGDETAGTAPRDTKNNLIRTLDVIYAFNPTAYVKFCVLEGTMGDTSVVDNGTDEALQDLSQHTDIEWFMFCNKDPLAEGVEHATLSVDSTELINSPRFYCAGLDFYSIFGQDGVSRPIDDAALAAWSGFKSNVGLGVNYVGNHIFDFSRVLDPPTTSTIETSVEIGGQYAVAAIVALCSRNSPNYDFGGSVNEILGKLVYGTRTYLINTRKNEELYSILDNHWITTIFKNNSYVFSKATTFTSDDKWNIYQSRAITNYIHKFLVLNLNANFELSITPNLITSIYQNIKAFLASWLNVYITDYELPVVRLGDAVDTLVIQVSFVPIFPLNRIDLGLIIGGGI